ncbi:MAG: hypothetical protein O7C59_09700, partial [Rickettsia endosymbiont of Ixodes persulcatus]|nr:hypothetical protein [Rickettsia endosymbiont of Ixodes persulcatus]
MIAREIEKGTGIGIGIGTGGIGTIVITMIETGETGTVIVIEIGRETGRGSVNEVVEMFLKDALHLFIVSAFYLLVSLVIIPFFPCNTIHLTTVRRHFRLPMYDQHSSQFLSLQEQLRLT